MRGLMLFSRRRARKVHCCVSCGRVCVRAIIFVLQRDRRVRPAPCLRSGCAGGSTSTSTITTNTIVTNTIVTSTTTSTGGVVGATPATITIFTPTGCHGLTTSCCTNVCLRACPWRRVCVCTHTSVCIHQCIGRALRQVALAQRAQRGPKQPLVDALGVKGVAAWQNADGVARL